MNISFSSQLASLNIRQTADSLDEVIKQLKKLTSSLNEGEGTLGAILKDRTVYDQLYQTVLSAELLLDDLRTHPKRYVNFSIFGKKEKNPPLQFPLKKDSSSRKSP